MLYDVVVHSFAVMSVERVPDRSDLIGQNLETNTSSNEQSLGRVPYSAINSGTHGTRLSSVAAGWTPDSAPDFNGCTPGNRPGATLPTVAADLTPDQAPAPAFIPQQGGHTPNNARDPGLAHH